MKLVFQLGPNHWRPRRIPFTRRPAATPQDLRIQVRDWTKRNGVETVLMEEEAEGEDEQSDPAHKFARILDDHAFDAIFVVWPHGAKMAATWDELLYLVERGRRQALPPVHAFTHTRAASFGGGVLKIKERGDRSLYLRGVQRLAMHPWYWRDLPMLESAVAEACATVAGIPPAPAEAADAKAVENRVTGKSGL